MPHYVASLDQGRLWKTRERRNNMQIPKQKDITLEEVLDRSEGRITLKEKRTIAVIMAYAALHGSDGPWLSENWDKNHICFFKNKSSSGQPDLERPFLMVSFREDCSTAQESRDLLTTSSWEALGILLFEIHTKEAIESQYMVEDLINGEPNPMTNLTTAVRLLDATKDELYERYRSAVNE